MINNRRIAFLFFCLFMVLGGNALSLAQEESKDAIAYYNLGNGYAVKGQYEKAIEEYTKAIALDPKFAKAYYNRGLAYAGKGRDELALVLLGGIDSDTPYNAGKEQYDRAIEDYDKAIALDPRHAEAYYSRGYAYASTGRYDKAIPDFQKACDLGYKDGCKELEKLKSQKP